MGGVHGPQAVHDGYRRPRDTGRHALALHACHGPAVYGTPPDVYI